MLVSARTRTLLLACVGFFFGLQGLVLSCLALDHQDWVAYLLTPDSASVDKAVMANYGLALLIGCIAYFFLCFTFYPLLILGTVRYQPWLMVPAMAMQPIYMLGYAIQIITQLTLIGWSTHCLVSSLLINLPLLVLGFIGWRSAVVCFWQIRSANNYLEDGKRCPG